MRIRWILFILLLLLGFNANTQEVGDWTVTAQGIDGKSHLIFKGENNSKVPIQINKTDYELDFVNGQAILPLKLGKKSLLLINGKQGTYNDYKLVHVQASASQYRTKNIPLWLSIIPPLFAIILALVFKEVIISLFVGIWSGAFIANGMDPLGIFWSIGDVVETYVVGALSDSDHVSVIVFSLLIGGMVAIISRNGGMVGVVNKLTQYAKTPRSTQFVTWLLGVAIFFDDYANTLIVGNTMRSATDKFKISREKLAYIVDSTAAPVSAIAFITTWIGAELGYISSGLEALSGYETAPTAGPYAIFLSSLKYSFYPILTLIFILLVIYTRRDFGQMYKAELRARTTGEVSRKTTDLTEEADMEDLDPVKGASLNWLNAFLPVASVILVTIYGLISTGMDASYNALVADNHAIASDSWGEIWSKLNLLGDGSRLGVLIGNANSYAALIWASLTGVLFALVLTLREGIMKLSDTMNTLLAGFKTMLPAVIVLTLAWSLAAITKDLYTADFLTLALGDALNPYMLPVIVFLLAALIAFSTGSSWSTMAILYPIAIPLTWAICMANGVALETSLEIFSNVIAVVLAASVLGDHCSPISDTTILSSLASDCNHIDHVRTQMPYALLVGVFSLLCGGLSTLLGGGGLVCFILIVVSVALMYGILMKFGKKIED